MFEYLFYKLYRAVQLSSLADTAEFTASIFFGGLIAVNIFVINALLSNVHITEFFLKTGEQAGLFGFLCILFSCFYFLSKIRYRKILTKFSKEADVQRVRGNVIVAVYVAISFLSIFAVAFFKPGKI